MNKKILCEITILYIEDEADVREFTGRTLTTVAKKVYLANDCEEALEIYKKNIEIDLIITDINMPRMNGLEMCKIIRKMNSSIPIVITSAHNDPSFLKESINIGVSAYCMKPIDLYQLIESIQKAYEPVYLKKQLKKIHNDALVKNEISKKKIYSILDTQDNLVALLNKDSISYLNKKFCDFFLDININDFKNRSENILDLFERENGYFSKNSFKNSDDFLNFISNKKSSNFIVKILKNNSCYIFSLNIEIYDIESSLYMLSLNDISKRALKAQILDYKKSYDALTNLYNRNKFNDIFQKELRRDIRYKNELTVLLLDLDDFSKINQKYSYEEGNKLLIKVSDILLKQLREHDILARWGGEEFIILLPQTNIQGAIIVAQKINKKILDIKEFKISSSIGLSSYFKDDTADMFINKATNALNTAKQNGKNRIEVFK